MRFEKYYNLIKDDNMKNINAVYVSLAALVVAVAALVVSIISCKSNDNTAVVEAALIEKPEMIFSALQAAEEKQRAEAERQIEEKIKANADELYNRADDGVIGNPDGKLVLVEFFDYSCSFCHRLYPVLKEVIAANPDVKVVAKPLAFMSKASIYAAQASLAAAEQGKFAEAYSAIFEIKGGLTEAKIDEALTALGLDMVKLKEDMKSDKVSNTMKAASDMSAEIQVSGVPTMVFNNKILQTLDAPVIQEAIDAAK